MKTTTNKTLIIHPTTTEQLTLLILLANVLKIKYEVITPTKNKPNNEELVATIRQSDQDKKDKKKTKLTKKELKSLEKTKVKSKILKRIKKGMEEVELIIQGKAKGTPAHDILKKL